MTVSRGVDVSAAIERDTFRRTVELQAQPGETIGITGDIGSGKSSVLWLLAGRLSPASGQVTVPASSTLLTQMFQADLDEERSGVENVSDAILALAPNAVDTQDAARSILSELGVADHVVDRLPWTFSGAESQRVALARALAPRPELILLDEPTGALDKSGRANVSAYLESWLEDFEGVAFVASTNVELLNRLTDRVIPLS